MTISARPYARKNTLEINGYQMAYIDEGEGDAIVFQHGNPTSSYLWRNIMPHCEGLGRLIACDLIGMGDSDKLSPSDDDRYSFAENKAFLSALWEQLDLGDNIILVLHDWGSALGFDWACEHRDRIQGIAYMESIVQPFFSGSGAATGESNSFHSFLHSDAAATMMLQDNAYVEQRLPDSIIRTLDDTAMNEYRRPFLQPGEDRRPTLSWPRQFPHAGQPEDVCNAITHYGKWLSESDVPKLFINANPGKLLVGEARDFCRRWPNQTEVTVNGLHFIQEDSPQEIGAALASFVKSLRLS